MFLFASKSPPTTNETMAGVPSVPTTPTSEQGHAGDEVGDGGANEGNKESDESKGREGGRGSDGSKQSEGGSSEEYGDTIVLNTDEGRREIAHPNEPIFDTMDAIMKGNWAHVPLFVAQTMDYISKDVPVGMSKADFAALIGGRATRLLRHLTESLHEAKRQEEAARAAESARRSLPLFAPSSRRRDALLLATGLLLGMYEPFRLFAFAACARLVSGVASFDSWMNATMMLVLACALQWDERIATLFPGVLGWASGVVLADSH